MGKASNRGLTAQLKHLVAIGELQCDCASTKNGQSKKYLNLTHASLECMCILQTRKNCKGEDPMELNFEGLEMQK